MLHAHSFRFESAENVDAPTIVLDLMDELKTIDGMRDNTPDGDQAAQKLRVETVQKALLESIKMKGSQPAEIEAISQQIPTYLNSHQRSVQDLIAAAVREDMNACSLQLKGITNLFMGWFEKNKTSTKKPYMVAAATLGEVMTKVRDQMNGRGGLELDPATRRTLGVQGPGIERIPERGNNPRAMWQHGMERGDDGQRSAA